MDYQRAQCGMLTYVLAFFALAIPGIMFVQGKQIEQWQEAISPILILPLIFLLFYKLTITVTREYIKVSFGIGIISFKVKPTKVLSTEIIHPKWWWGIGIRITPKGWLYNVAMGPAVLIHYEKEGKRHSLFIGSPEPEVLISAIHANFQD